jgi:hypothetical protein
MVERFAPALTVRELKAADPKIAAVPALTKNMFMCRAFAPIDDDDLDHIVASLRELGTQARVQARVAGSLIRA